VASRGRVALIALGAGAGVLVLFVFTVWLILAVSDDGLPGGAKVAVVEVEGVIGVGAERGLDTESIIRTLAEYRDDPAVRAVVLRIDSPGGVVAPTQEIFTAVRRLREAKKPVVASLGSIAASGGYYVAVSADRIFASPGTLTGSTSQTVNHGSNGTPVTDIRDNFAGTLFNSNPLVALGTQNTERLIPMGYGFVDQDSPASMNVLVNGGWFVTADTGVLAQTTLQVVAISAADLTNPRKDVVYVNPGNGLAGVITGTPGAVPAIPVLPLGMVPLAIVTVPAGAATILEANITDVRRSTVSSSRLFDSLRNPIQGSFALGGRLVASAIASGTQTEIGEVPVMVPAGRVLRLKLARFSSLSAFCQARIYCGATVWTSTALNAGEEYPDFVMATSAGVDTLRTLGVFITNISGTDSTINAPASVSFTAIYE